MWLHPEGDFPSWPKCLLDENLEQNSCNCLFDICASYKTKIHLVIDLRDISDHEAKIINTGIIGKSGCS